MPARAVVPLEEEKGLLQYEFEMGAEELRVDPYFAVLKQAGLARFVESADGRDTIALRARMDSPEDVAVLRGAEQFQDCPVSTHVFRMILGAGARLCDYPAMTTLSAELGKPVESCAVQPAEPTRPDPESDDDDEEDDDEVDD